jgi:hypothetical protein
MAWSRAGHTCCLGCGTTERRHMARGYCEICYSRLEYARNAERERRIRKASRLRMTEEETAALYAKQKAWKEANRARALASQAAHYQRNKHLINRWPLGSRVWAMYAGVWCEGRIVARINHNKALVRLKGGTELEFGTTRNCKLRKEPPELFGGILARTPEVERYVEATRKVVLEGVLTVPAIALRHELRILAGVGSEIDIRVCRALKRERFWHQVDRRVA